MAITSEDTPLVSDRLPSVWDISLDQAGWGITWYINGTLIPELVLTRGQTYTFVVYGGDDPMDPARYHPFYITSSSSGGLLLNQNQNQVRHTCP